MAGRNARHPFFHSLCWLLCLALLAAACTPEPKAAPDKPKASLTTWTEPSTGLEFVWIEPGCFLMGQTVAERAQLLKEVGEYYTKRMFDNEPASHEVCIKEGFWMSRTEVTQKAWHTLMADKRSFCQPADEHPANFVTWNEAYDFAKKLAIAHENKYLFRLPTEAEWEYAARAGTTTFYNTGETINPDQANYQSGAPFNGGKKGPYREAPTPVGSFAPNAFGLYDMHGNIEEWCDDVYQQPAPEHGRGDPVPFRVVKGGRWIDHAMHIRTAARRGYTPFYVNCQVGFRIVRTK